MAQKGGRTFFYRITRENLPISTTFSICPAARHSEKTFRTCLISRGGVARLGSILFTFEVVPEPSTYALMGVGALGLAAYGWRRKKKIALIDDRYDLLPALADTRRPSATLRGPQDV